MPEVRFELLGITFASGGMCLSMRCLACGRASGFLFTDEILFGKYPLACFCGSVTILMVERMTTAHELAQSVQRDQRMAPSLKRRGVPSMN